MNRIRESMEGIKASQELKADTLRYLEWQRSKRSRPVWRRGSSYVLAVAICLLFMFGVGWRTLYSMPTSYISMDVNPSIELGINRYGRVVAVEAYNEDGQDILQHLSLKNKSYVQAVISLLENEIYQKYLVDNATLVFTIISDSPEAIRKELDAIDAGENYQILTYTSDSHCREEAHHYEMSFGKYRAYLELVEYDRSVTVEDCHGMSMGEIQDRIEGCRQHKETEHNENHGGGNMNSGSEAGNTGNEAGNTGNRSEVGNTGNGSEDGYIDSGSGGGGHGGHHGGHHSE